MKIGPLTNLITYPQFVREKQDGGNSGAEYFKENSKKNPKDKDSGKTLEEASSNEDVEPSTAQSVGRAVIEFLADKQTLSNGLSAVVEGQGPGLKVVLKDQNGEIVRQLSGEEFLRLRKGVSKEAPLPGKILDQKL